MRILALDPATTTGWATWADGEWNWGSVKPCTNPAKIQEACLKFRDFAPDIFAIESCYVDRNIKAAINLGVIRGMWVQAIYEHTGLDRHTLINPASWKAELLNINGKAVRTRKLQKDYSKHVASLLVGKKIRKDDEADAICIAEWVRCHAIIEGMIR